MKCAQIQLVSGESLHLGYGQNQGRLCPLRATALLVILMLLVLPRPTLGGDELRLTLDAAADLALKYNRTLKASDARYQASKHNVKEARTGFLPKISAEGAYTRLDERPYISAGSFSRMFDVMRAPVDDLVERGYLDPATLSGFQPDGPSKIYVGDDDNYRIGISLEQPLFTGFGVLESYRMAKYESDAERWNLQSAENRVRYNVAGTYIQIVKARANLQVADESVEQMEAHITDLRNLLDAGMVIRNDLLMAEVQLSNLRLLRSRAGNGVDLSMAALCHELGIGLETTIIPVDSLPQPPDIGATLDEYSNRALRERPELRAMNDYLGISRSSIRITRGQYLPSVFLIGNYEWNRPDREYNPEFYDSWNVTLAFRMNIFDWGAIYHQIAQAKLSHEEREENLHLLTDGILLEVKQSYLAWQEANRAVEIAEEGLEQAEENFRVTRENFHQGMMTNSDLLDAQTLLTRAKVQRVGALADLYLAQAWLELATGAISER